MSDAANSDDRDAAIDAAAQELDSLGRATGIEVETTAIDTVAPEESGSRDEIERINDPFNPDKIDVVTRTPTVDLLLSRIRNGRIDLEPEFQRRRGIWSRQAKSRLIESLLLRIPLPTLYAAESDDESWVIVDGIQRLTAITEFIEPVSLDGDVLILHDLEYLSQYDGKSFEDLPVRLQTRLREAELVVHLIRLGTPEPVKFNIFARINTGGTPLSAQELRHALVPGQARSLLRRWAESDHFIKATGGSIRSERMADREMVLRFVAFRLAEPSSYTFPDFDEFLREAMRQLNGLSPVAANRLEKDFFGALDAARSIFRGHAFRKQSPNTNYPRSPVNKALFEVITVNLASLNSKDRLELIRRRDSVQEGFLQLMRDYYFISAISVGTGQVARVQHRFRAIDRLFREVLA